MFQVWRVVLTCKRTRQSSYFSAAHIFSRKGMKGMNPSSSAGSQSSFMRPLASSLLSFSPRLVRRRKSWFSRMVLSSFLSYSFMISKVVEASLVLGVLAFLEHGEDFGLGQDLLSLFLCSSDGLDGLHGGVDVAGPHQVASIEGIDLAVTLEVIDIEGEVKSFDFLLLESKLGPH